MKLQRKSKSLTLEYEQEIEVNELLNVLEMNNFMPARYETGESSIENLFLEVTK